MLLVSKGNFYPIMVSKLSAHSILLKGGIHGRRKNLKSVGHMETKATMQTERGIYIQICKIWVAGVHVPPSSYVYVGIVNNISTND